MTVTALTLAAGGLVGLAVVLAMMAARPSPAPDLQSALQHLSGDIAATAPEPPEASVIGRVGRWFVTTCGVRTSAARRTQLQMRGYTPSRLAGERLLSALVLAVMPWVFMALFSALDLARFTVPVPAFATVALAGVGWFYPVWTMRRQQSSTASDAHEALLVFIDLVVLERLGNQAAVDAMTHAAFLSDNPLFVQIQQVLNRADLENVDPWKGLENLADDIDLPELNDVVAIARLQEEGASLAGSFRARVAELRNAYLLQMQREAEKVTQRMDGIKAIPTLAIILLMAAAAGLGVLNMS
ncbi:hypothetical protein [Acidipropionibacterium acidipropionici]|uniref:Type II secretion system protein GspF domain-containing protein n=1 Tax=Acidipropionibacterium acidipropionici TaxID=1748 RepID=A0AAC8YBX8_9ACTN|nr:hypothetical protein [Acidipropionibacterium acidipropionici]AMS04111.1 hypothetical protein AXH35_00060 [Acidipropionibacterium acidipropionici]